MLTIDQIDLIRRSFALIMQKKEETGRLFYERLFIIAPELRILFKNDMNAQATKLMDTLGVAVSALRDTPSLVGTLQSLGHRHRSYGVRPGNYTKVGEALIWTFEKALGSTFDAPTRAAWVDLYGVVAATMEPTLVV